MHRFVLGAILAFAASPAIAQQTAGEVYQWTDANGVTHYSQTPPDKGSYEHRLITSSGATASPATADSATAAESENPQCATARANIAALQGEGDVQQDTDGDGEPDTVLDAGQRAAQLELAQAAVKAYCTP